MANFESAFQRLMRDEGIALTNDPADKGGQTFCGISRKSHPKWTGWKFIDAGDTPPTEMVREFYEQMYWLPVRGNDITSQRIAEVIFGQYVNMGTQAIKLAQQCAGVVADGKIGLVCSQASSRAIAAACFTAGGSESGWSAVSQTGADAGDDEDTAGSEADVTGVATFAESGLGSAPMRFFSRFAGGGTSGVPVMLRLIAIASSSNGLAFSDGGAGHQR